jgi:hypothetical protein
VESRPRLTITAFTWAPLAPGAWFSSPVASWTFCACSARFTSAGVRPKAVSCSGLSQTRIEYSLPNMMASPTPGTRRSGSSTLAAAKLPRSIALRLPSFE